MKSVVVAWAVALGVCGGGLGYGTTAAKAQEIRTDWAYHGVGEFSCATEAVPGEAFSFLANGPGALPQDALVTLYVLTDHEFAGEMDEQVFVRWWDGYMAHWIMGTWVKNVTLSSALPLRGHPQEGEAFLDLWKIEVPAWVTQPGENYYAIQLKGYRGDVSEERYLLCHGNGDFARRNELGQVWSSSEEFDGQDWKVTIQP